MTSAEEIETMNMFYEYVNTHLDEMKVSLSGTIKTFQFPTFKFCRILGMNVNHDTYELNDVFINYEVGKELHRYIVASIELTKRMEETQQTYELLKEILSKKE